MNKKLLISMLHQGNDGNEILAILDTISTDDSDSLDLNIHPTLDEIEF